MKKLSQIILIGFLSLGMFVGCATNMRNTRQNAEQTNRIFHSYNPDYYLKQKGMDIRDYHNCLGYFETFISKAEEQFKKGDMPTAGKRLSEAEECYYDLISLYFDNNSKLMEILLKENPAFSSALAKAKQIDQNFGKR